MCRVPALRRDHAGRWTRLFLPRALRGPDSFGWRRLFAHLRGRCAPARDGVADAVAALLRAAEDPNLRELGNLRPLLAQIADADAVSVPIGLGLRGAVLLQMAMLLRVPARVMELPNVPMTEAARRAAWPWDAGPDAGPDAGRAARGPSPDGPEAEMARCATAAVFPSRFVRSHPRSRRLLAEAGRGAAACRGKRAAPGERLDAGSTLTEAVIAPVALEARGFDAPAPPRNASPIGAAPTPDLVVGTLARIAVERSPGVFARASPHAWPRRCGATARGAARPSRGWGATLALRWPRRCAPAPGARARAGSAPRGAGPGGRRVGNSQIRTLRLRGRAHRRGGREPAGVRLDARARGRRVDGPDTYARRGAADALGLRRLPRLRDGRNVWPRRGGGDGGGRARRRVRDGRAAGARRPRTDGAAGALHARGAAAFAGDGRGDGRGRQGAGV